MGKWLGWGGAIVMFACPRAGGASAETAKAKRTVLAGLAASYELSEGPLSASAVVRHGREVEEVEADTVWGAPHVLN